MVAMIATASPKVATAYGKEKVKRSRWQSLGRGVNNDLYDDGPWASTRTAPCNGSLTCSYRGCKYPLLDITRGEHWGSKEEQHSRPRVNCVHRQVLSRQRMYYFAVQSAGISQWPFVSWKGRKTAAIRSLRNWLYHLDR